MTKFEAMSAVDASRALLEGTASAQELVESALARIDHINPAVNAMVTVAADQARTAAQFADQQLATAVDRQSRRELMDTNPLLGLPVAIKDLQATAGIRTTLGSAQFADNIPDTDAAIVAKIRDAGGIVVGKTNIPERSIGANTVNRLFGATGNPFDPTKTCGGSSGGSAVALATEMVPLATGSDHGGSLRIPACYCGVVGYRATPGVVPFEERAISQTFYSVQGPMARTVDDVALLLSVISRRTATPADPMAFPLDPAALNDLDDVDLAGLRVGVSEDLGGVLVSRPVRHAFRRRVDWLADHGVACSQIDLDLRDGAEVDWRLRADVFATYYHREAESWDDGFNPNITAGYQSALATPMVEIARARYRQIELIRSVQTALSDVDVLLCPGVSVSPFPWRQLYPTDVDGNPVDNYMAWLTLTAAFTVVGHPVVAMPAGLGDDGLPFGVQLVGPMFADRRLLSTARALEQAWTGTDFAPPRPDLEALLASSVELGPEATADLFD